jgi:hypothetical protein
MAEWERELNALVYEVYGLTEEAAGSKHPLRLWRVESLKR